MRYLFILFKIFTEMNYSIDFSSYKEYDNPQEMSNLYYEWTKDINEKREAEEEAALIEDAKAILEAAKEKEGAAEA